MKRNKAVQEAVQRNIIADKMRLFNNKCINSKKNKAKGFWEMLRDNKTNATSSQIIDPVDKTTIIDKKGKIEKCLIKHFGNIGRDSTLLLELGCVFRQAENFLLSRFSELRQDCASKHLMNYLVKI